MKITIEEKQNEPKRVYPYLGKHMADGYIVAFTAPRTGVVVNGNGHHEEWHTSDRFQEQYFTPIHPQPEPEPIPVEQRKYPYVGVAKNGTLLKILFTRKNSGIVINPGDIETESGNCSNMLDESQFTPIPVGKIIIELD